MVRKMTIRLKSTEEVREFVKEVMMLQNDYDLISGKYVTDAKSILGIYSLNLSKPLELVMRGERMEDLTVLEKYIVRS
ncbi:MAG: HPr family phosphocarrier protein [Lachnospiraceae bacterium]